MRLNIFNVKEKKENRIIIEEEHKKNRFLLFFLKIRKFLFLSIMCILLVIIGLSFSLFRGSNDYDITYIVGDKDIIANTDPSIDDDDIKNELLGGIAREEGVVLLVRTVMTRAGDVISYFTDKSAILVKSNGKIYRISSNIKGHYGISDKGKLDATAIKILVTSTTSTLSDGAIVTNYSDGTARVDLNGNAIFVRDSNNIELFNGSSFDKTKPSGVALSKKINRVAGYYINSFTDKTTLVEYEGRKYVVNKNVVPNINGFNVKVDWNNAYVSISEQKYGDYIINHYVNGSATITDKNANVFFVRKSGDLVLKNKEFYEILPNEKGESIKAILTPNRTNVIYYTSGVAVVVNSNGDRYYVEDADEIIYDGNKNINDNYNKANLLEVRSTINGELSYNFDNGKSQVIRKNDSSYIVDTETLEFKPIEDVEIPDVEEELPGTTPEPINPEDWDFLENNNTYDGKIRTNEFSIKNNSNKKKYLRIAIAEVSDYTNYIDTQYINLDAIDGDIRLDPKYVKFNVEFASGSNNGKVGNLSKDKDTGEYIIADNVQIGAKENLAISVFLSVDYNKISETGVPNYFQNKAFIGTIKIYLVED